MAVKLLWVILITPVTRFGHGEMLFDFSFAPCAWFARIECSVLISVSNKRMPDETMLLNSSAYYAKIN